jgi:hypothetical protein
MTGPETALSRVCGQIVIPVPFCTLSESKPSQMRKVAPYVGLVRYPRKSNLDFDGSTAPVGSTAPPEGHKSYWILYYTARHSVKLSRTVPMTLIQAPIRSPCP